MAKVVSIYGRRRRASGMSDDGDDLDTGGAAIDTTVDEPTVNLAGPAPAGATQDPNQPGVYQAAPQQAPAGQVYNASTNSFVAAPAGSSAAIATSPYSATVSGTTTAAKSSTSMWLLGGGLALVAAIGVGVAIHSHSQKHKARRRAA